MLKLRAAALILLAILTANCKPAAELKKNHRAEKINQGAKPNNEWETTKPSNPCLAESAQVASLINPAMLATLKLRGANPRILKITAILWTARASRKNPEEIVAGAIEAIGWGDTEKGRLTTAAILRNLDIAEKLGSTTPEDIAAMRRGRSPNVRKGPYAGDILSLDHIIPVAAVPELSNVVGNLELMPLRANQRKNDKIGDRQRDLAQKFYAAGLLAEPKKLR